MKKNSQFWWLILVKGIILIALAFFILNHPVATLIGVSIYIGAGLLITGSMLTTTAIIIRKDDHHWGWKLAEGIFDIIFGFILLSNPAVTAAVFPFVVGFWVIIYGVMLFADSFSRKKDGDTSWWLNTLGGIITAILGYIIMNNFIAGTIAITYWIGTGFLIFGILNVSIAFRVKKL